jgi:transcriptional regulator GlxA family with amidase domain
MIFSDKICCRLPVNDYDMNQRDMAGENRSSSAAVRQIRMAFLLTDGFALMSYASIAEPFRAANVLSGQTLYGWRHLSTRDPVARASNGAHIVVDGTIREDETYETIFVFAAGNPAQFHDEATFAALRRHASRGVRLVGVSGGPYLLAKAGLLDGHRATIHWEHQPAFAEAFPRVALERALYVVDKGRVTCAGGTAGLDLAVELIGGDHGEALGTMVGEWHIRTQARESQAPQRMSLQERYNVWNPKLLQLLALMEANIAEPLPREALASAAGISLRQVERLFATHLSMTLGECYRSLRLAHAITLLKQTSLSITEVAVACGFTSPSHFSRMFAKLYGFPPTMARHGQTGGG